VVDVFTLFAANAITLIVMAGGFCAAWAKQRAAAYWLSWIAANVVLAVALVMFMFMPPGNAWTAALSHCFLVLGFGLRWRAAQQFTHGRATWWPTWVPVCGTIFLYAFPGTVSAGLAFAIVNVVLAGQAGAIAHHFWKERSDATFSSYGLVFAYGLMAFSFAVRVVQGLAFLDEMTSYLPRDEMLQLHLLAALVHVSSSGAFALSIAYERTVLRLRCEHDRVEAEARKLGQLAERDALTGLMNRRAIERHFAGLRRAGFNTIAVVDLDHFKAINDIHGHGKGDEVLRSVARALDPDSECLAIRMGGEEFMLLLRGRDGPRRAEQRRQAITRSVLSDVSGLDRLVTASMGLIALPRDAMTETSFEKLYSIADRLLYEAKQNGRNRTVSERITVFDRRPRLRAEHGKVPGGGGGADSEGAAAVQLESAR
jgi:diguanylate cyclase (GGDEF)-like protein